jgi:hypothetical protein
MQYRFASGAVPSIGVYDETQAVVCCGGGKNSNVQYHGFCTVLTRSGTDIAKGNEVRVSDTQLHLNLAGGHGADVTILKNGGAIFCSAVNREGECKYLARMGDDGKWGSLPSTTMQLKSDSRITFETNEINHVGVATVGSNGNKALLCYGDRHNSYTKCTLITTAGTFVKSEHPMVSMEAMDRWDMISVSSNSAMLCGRPQGRGGSPNKRDYTIACHVIDYDESADTVTISSQSEDITEDSRKNDYRYVSISMVDGTNTIFLCSNMDMFNERCTTIGTPVV